MQRDTSDDSSPVSVAETYARPAQMQINPRTGQLTLTIAVPPRKGVLAMDINLGITYSQGTSAATDWLFGLPAGWTYSLSYILGGTLVINGSQRYGLDPEMQSGLQYYYRKDLTLASYSPGSYPTLPYGIGELYAFKLTFLDGHNQYFDPYGRLICWDDKDGNPLLYAYDKADTDIAHSKLVSVTDHNGQVVELTYESGGITVSYPPSDQNNVSFRYEYSTTTGKLTAYVDPVGERTTLEFQGGIVASGLLSSVSYPNALTTKLTYGTINYLSSGQELQRDVVRSLESEYAGQIRTTSFDYDPLGDAHNYTGYPTHDVQLGVDSLFQSDDNAYRYRTIVDDGINRIEYEYNRLHLLLTATTLAPSGSAMMSKTETTYVGEGADRYFPPFNLLDHNYQSPQKQVTTYYNDAGDTRQTQREWTYNDYGQTTSLKTYQQAGGGLQLAAQTDTTYDTTFGLILSRRILDYKADGVLTNTPAVTRADNTLTTDSKHIATTTRGVEANGSFEPQYVTTLEYDEQGRPTSNRLSWAPGHSGDGVSETGYSMTYAVDGNNLVRAKRDAEGNVSSELYDLATGFLLAKSNARGGTVTYTYDDLGRILSRTDTMGSTATWSYNTPAGLVTKVSPNGYVIREYYNGYGHLLRKADNLGPEGGERTLATRVYDDVGQCTSSRGILGDGSCVSYEYDTWGRVASRTDATGNVSSYTYDPVARTRTTYFNGVLVDTTTYDDAGRVSTTESMDTGDEGQFSSVVDLRDGQGRVVRTTFSATAASTSAVQTNTYDLSGNTVSKTLGGSEVTQTIGANRDLLGKVLQLTAELSGSSTPRASSSTRAYNALGQLSHELTGLGRTRSYKYDAVGNRTLATDFDGTTVVDTYYLNNKVATRSYTDGSDEVELRFTYCVGTGQLQTVERFVNGVGEGTTKYAYALDGKLVSLTYPDGVTLCWSYDASTGLLESSNDASGATKTYSYDGHGRLVGISCAAAGASVSISYLSVDDTPMNAGRIGTVSYSNGITLSFAYNGYGLYESITATDADGTVLTALTYAYDAATKRVVQERIEAAGGPDALNRTIAYAYDDVGRLVGQSTTTTSGTSNTSWTYDAAGNVTSETVTDASGATTTTYAYDADNRLVTVSTPAGDATLEYDDNGNLTRDDLGNRYAYNALNQLIEFTDIVGTATTYAYYPTGLRSSKVAAGHAAVAYYYDGATVPNLVNEVQGDTVASYLGAASVRYARILTGAGARTSYYFAGRKSILATFDPDGGIATSYEYDAWGRAEQALGVSIASNPFGYCGEYTDAESGLVYLRARYYSPRLMRFTTRDTVLTFNAYCYANANPVMNMDPSGHSSIWITIGLIVGTVALIAASVAVTVLTGGVAGPELAAADAAELSGVAADVAATAGEAAVEGAAEGGAAAGDAAASSAEFGTDIGVDVSSSTEETIQTSFGGLGNPVNVTGGDTNCVFCTAGFLSDQTSTDVANAVGLDEGLVQPQNVMGVFRQAGLTGASDFDLVTNDPYAAYNYMSSEQAGTEFAFGYQPENASIGHFLVAQSEGAGQPIQFIDAQAGTSFFDAPSADASPTRYFVVRADSQMARLTTAFSRMTIADPEMDSLIDAFSRLTINA